MPDAQISEEMMERGAREIFDSAVGLGNWDNEFYSEERTGCFDAARRCLAAALFGHVVVPREPTEAMLSAGDSKMPQIAAGQDITTGYDALKEAYRGWPNNTTRTCEPTMRTCNGRVSEAAIVVTDAPTTSG